MEVKKETINATINGNKGKTSTPDAGKTMIAPHFVRVVFVITAHLSAEWMILYLRLVVFECIRNHLK
jgi:hypothetical protein